MAKAFYSVNTNVIIREDVGKCIKQLRLHNNMSQYDLAHYLKISRQAISKWERGITLPAIFTLLDLSRVFDLPLDYFLRNR